MTGSFKFFVYFDLICKIFPALMFSTRVTQNVSAKRKKKENKQPKSTVHSVRAKRWGLRGHCGKTSNPRTQHLPKSFSPVDNPKYVAVSNQFGYECVLGQHQNNWFHRATGAALYWTCRYPPSLPHCHTHRLMRTSLGHYLESESVWQAARGAHVFSICRHT